MNIKFKKILSTVVMALFISGNLIGVSTVKAEESKEKIKIKVAKLNESELPEKFTGSDGREYKRVGPVQSNVKEVLSEVRFGFDRPGAAKYYVNWNEATHKFQGHSTNIWDPSSDGSKQLGYHIIPYVPGKTRFGLADGGKILYDPPMKSDGSDVLGKQFSCPGSNGAMYTFMLKGFSSGVEFKITNDMLTKELGGIYSSESVFVGGDLTRIGCQDNRLIDKKGKACPPGLDYRLFEDKFFSRGLKLDTYYSTKPSGNWISPSYMYSGCYGKEYFNYYTPEYTLNLKYVAEYETIPPTPVPPTPVPPKPSSGVQERGKVGPIIFKPNETSWSNRGKISEGKGAYNTDVIYTGDLQIVYRGTVKSKERECSGSGEDRSCWWNYYEEDFEVVYDLDRIDVSGDASKTFSGQSSDIDITHEGENLGLDAIGTWQPAKYHVPSMRGSIYSTIIPKEPPRPKGHSGDYDIDWTMPTIEIDDIAHDRAINELTFGVDVDDNLEPMDCITVTAPTEYGVDGTLDNQNQNHRNITYSNIPNEDTNYEFHYDVEDRGTNKRICSFTTSVVREYWEQMMDDIGTDLDTEVPLKFLSNSDTQTLKGFKHSKTIDFDTWRGIPVEVWYKFTGKTVNFIRVIHYDDPKLSIIDENGNKLYPTDTEFKDSPGLANKIGVDVGSNMEITNYGRLSLQTPVKTVDNNDGIITNYYMNGDVRTIDKATGKLVKDRQKGYGEILNDLTEHIGNKTIYRTGNRYIITITDCGSYSDMLVQDRNLNTVEHTKINR